MKRVQTFFLSLSVFAATVILGLELFVGEADADNEEPETSPGGRGGDSGRNVILPIEIPVEWGIDVVGVESGGWRQTGVAPGSLEDVAEEVGAIMVAHGFSESRRVDDDELGGSRRLIQYSTQSGIKVLWMLWDMGGTQTGFSWGREK